MEGSSRPLVSVIIAFLNEERFLAEAIESVLEQDYAHWQLLLVDDGSTDGSTSIAKGYAARFPGQVVYCEHEGHTNKGVTASRNHGIRRGSGPLLAILDADDVWRAGKLSAQVRIFQEHPAVAMVAEASLYWHSWDAPADEDVLVPVGAPADRAYRPIELLLLLYPLASGSAPCPSGLMLTRQAWEAVGGFEDSFTQKYQLYEDQAFLSKIYLTEHVYVSAACHNLYRQHSASCVQSVKQQGHYHTVRAYFLEWLADYLKAAKISSRPVHALLAQALFPYRHPVAHRIASFQYKHWLNSVIELVRA